jgi:uncharacterized protein involved in response to NO
VQSNPKTPGKIHAYRLFFPAASLYAATVIPLSVYVMRAGGTWPAGLAGYGHAHEMLFGFALALVAGYTLGPLARHTLFMLLALWLAARSVSVGMPAGPAAGLLNTAFALALAALVVPRFLTAKKWRNRMISPLLLGLCALPVAYAITSREHVLFLQSVLLFSLLMVFMGGRIIAPAAAGECGRRGFTLESRVQPRLEAALIVLLFTAALALFFPGGRLTAGLSAGVAGIVTAIRLWRWRLWRCERPDLAALGIGYGWLALGLVLFGGSLLQNAFITTALHVITVGALGTLSIGVMLRLHAQHTARRAPHAPVVLTTAALIGLATLSRVAADLVTGHSTPLLWAASATWSCAYLSAAFYLIADGKGQIKIRP